MAKKTPPPPRGFYAPLPCLLPPILAALFAGLSLRRYWFTQAAYREHTKLLGGSLWLSLALLLLVLARPAWRARAALHCERFEAESPGRRRAWLLAAFAGLWGLFFFVKYCQYRGFQLPLDTTATANLLYNILHNGTFACPALGVASQYAVHFSPIMALVAPFLGLGGVVGLLALQSALAASMPLAGYRLARGLTGSAAAGFSAAFLLATSPYLHDANTASFLPQTWLGFFFLWGMVFAEERRWGPAGACLALATGTSEHSCLVFLGLGLYLIARLGWRTPRAWLWGGAAGAAALLAFWAEMALRYSYPEAKAFRGWEMFAHLRGSGLAARLLWPPERWAATAGMLLSTGFLPLLSPASLLPYAINAAPAFAAGTEDAYHKGILQYAGYLMGPLWWAAVMGLARAHAALAGQDKRAWLLVLALAGGTLNLGFVRNPLQPDWNHAYFSEGPALAAKVPAAAALWALEFAAPPLAARARIKALRAAPDPEFMRGLFAPEFVLIDRNFMSLDETDWRDRVLTYLGREGYRKEAEGSQLVLLKRTRPLPALGAPLELPAPGPEAARVARDLRETDDWSLAAAAFRDGAEAGDPTAQYNLGVLHQNGQGVAQDPGLAMELWRAAAEGGIPDAQDRLGVDLIQKGRAEEGLRWLSLGADKGHAGCLYDLGVYYASSPPPARDFARAAQLFLLAAQQGHAMAEFNLGTLLSHVARGPEGLAEAEAWLVKARDHGVRQAGLRLAQLRAQGPRPRLDRAR